MHWKKIALTLLATSSLTHAAVIQENFTTDPLSHGWKTFGDTSLFQWNSTNQNLHVTWDSSQTNSYFYHPLGTILATNEDFSLEFDLRLNDIGPGPDGIFSFELAIGFLNIGQASGTNFLRGYAGIPGSGTGAPNLAEFAYFWDSGFGATVWPTLTDTNNYLYTANGTYSTNVFVIRELSLADWYHVTMTYTASNRTLITRAVNAEHTDEILVVTPLDLDSTFSDFRPDAISISSYNDNDGFGGSVLANGEVDNFVVTIPDPPLQAISGTLTNQAWQVQFASSSNWLYTLERTADFHAWTDVSTGVFGNGSTLSLPDTNAPLDNAFYRVRAERP
jgi:hypothetical protein